MLIIGYLLLLETAKANVSRTDNLCELSIDECT